MAKSRRKFLKNSALLGLGTILAPYALEAESKSSIPTFRPDKKLKILILGGTSFLGPHQISYALERGHEISTFTRGKTVPKVHSELFSKV